MGAKLLKQNNSLCSHKNITNHSKPLSSTRYEIKIKLLLLPSIPQVDLIPKLWFNLAIIPIKATMETSKPAFVLPASPGWCEPGQGSGPKILPEPQSENCASKLTSASKNAGFATRYQRRGSGFSRARQSCPPRRETGWYRGSYAAFCSRPWIGTSVFI